MPFPSWNVTNVQEKSHFKNSCLHIDFESVIFIIDTNNGICSI